MSSEINALPRPANHALPEGLKPVKGRSQGAQAIRSLLRNPSAMIGVVILLALLIVHLGAPLFTSVDPRAQNPRGMLQPPSTAHPFGTDSLGRDLFSRVLYGGRTSLLIAAVVTAITTVLGLALGALAAYFSKLDGPIMRVMDLLMAFPDLILAIAIVAVLGPRITNIMIALLFPITPRTARVVRSVMLSLKEQDFVTAANAVGVKHLRIILRHLVPNCIPALLVRQTFIFGAAVLAEAGLSFLGIGGEPGRPSLGMAVSEGRGYIRTLPSYSGFPGLFIVMMVLGINLFGDGLRDVLDPRMKH